MAASQMLLPSRATQPATCAGPAIAAGDLALRHDIQRLADAGVIKGTVTTWPLAWAPNGRATCLINGQRACTVSFPARPAGSMNQASCLIVHIITASLKQATVTAAAPSVTADSNHTLTPTPQDIASIDVSHRRVFDFGVIDVGYERIDDDASGIETSDARFYLQWRNAF